jgi:hypothetical protein
VTTDGVLKWRCIDQTGAILYDQTLGASVDGAAAPDRIDDFTNGGTYTITVYEATTSTNNTRFSGCGEDAGLKMLTEVASTKSRFMEWNQQQAR